MKEQDLPAEELPGFPFVEDRYYLGMWFLPLPKEVGPDGCHGGNMTALVWRKQDTPNEWHLRYRIRWCFEETAWGDKDKRSWYAGVLKGSEAEIEAKTAHWLRLCGGLAGVVELDFLPIRGIGGEAFQAAMDLHRPNWLHGQMVVNA